MNWIKKIWKETESNPKTIREFGFILTGFFLLFPLLANGIGILFAQRKFHYWFGWPVLSGAALVINLFLPNLMTMVFRVAMIFAHAISWVMMRLILSILFYVVISPISITMRIFGKDLLDEKLESSKASYWKKREKNIPKERYERLF